MADEQGKRGRPSAYALRQRMIEEILDRHADGEASGRGEPHVLGAKRGTTFVEAPWRRIRAAAGLADVRLHDLRHSFASVAAASGMGLPIIGKMLGQTQAQTTQRYAHLASDPVKEAAATVAGRIADAMKGYAPRSGKVVPLRSQGS